MEKEDKAENNSNKRRKRDDDGFSGWGGYMAAKRAKLLDQFKDSEIPRLSNIFEGVAIHVNGLTRPPIDELKKLMAAHGGLFHMYQVSSTTHIIASNLPNVKIKHLGTTPIVKPSWITDSIDFGKLLDYRRYLLYTNQSKTQPKIDFPVIEKAFTNNEPKINAHIATSSNELEENGSSNVPIINTSDTSQAKGDPTVAVTSTNTSQEPTGHSNSNLSGQASRFPTKTASDPNFLEEFYNNSRLHLISTLGAEFKHMVGQLRDKSTGKFPGREKLIALKAKENTHVIPHPIIMHIDMDCFFVSVSLRNHPELKGKPVAITHARNGQLSNVRPDQKANREQEFSLYSERLPIGVTSRVDKIDTQSSLSEIASCSYEARKCGIKNGMFLGQAVKMCPELQPLPYDFEGIKSVSHTLYETIALYTLDIEAVSCDEMYVDVTKILKETGMSVDEWGTYIRKEIMTITGCPCSTGFGTNRLQARLATRKAKPAGQYYLNPEAVEAYFVEVPLADLPGVGRATLSKLQNIGLHTCGDVQLASLKVLQSEIGQKAGETLKEQAMGIDNRPLNFYHERKSVSAEVNYGIRFKTVEECYTFLQNLSTEVYNRMNDINMRARCLTLKLLVRAPEAPLETAKFLGHGICDSLNKSTSSNTVLNNPQIIFKEAKILYEKLHPNFADLRGVGLQLTKLEKNAPNNTALNAFLKQYKAPENYVDAKKVDGRLSTNKVEKSEKTQSDTNVKDRFKSQDNNSAEKFVNVSVKRNDVSKGGSKRGRPKGSKPNCVISRKSIKKAGSINMYFGESKNVETRTKLNQGATQNLGIDMSVLNELPDDIKEEIMKEYNFQVKTKPLQTSQKNKANKCTINMVRPQKHSVDTTQKSPFSNLTAEQIKPIIRKWTESEDSPFDYDVEMISEHLKHLAIDRNIEMLFSIFNFLHRIFSVLNCNWHEAYFKIVNSTQEGMVARYGKTLLVQRCFQCCKM